MNKKIKNRFYLVILGMTLLCDMNAVNIGKRFDANKLETDVLVVGGGTAGTIAAIQSARLGVKTILIESGSQLGGTTTTGGVSFPGLFHAWGEQIIAGIGWELVSEAVKMNGNSMPDFKIPTGKNHWKHQIHVNGPLYALLAEEKALKAGVLIHYYETPLYVVKKGGYWYTKIAGKGTTCTIKSKQIIDCTGNAAVANLAGFKLLCENEAQPGSFIYALEGYDYLKLEESKLEERFDEALKAGLILKSDAYYGIKALLKGGSSTNHIINASSATSALHTRANIEGRESLLRILRFLKTIPGCENVKIKKMQTETAIRETYRIVGEYQITVDDYTTGKVFNDALSYSFYPIDLHIEEGVKPTHLQEGVVATIPLRALIPKNSENFLVAGRCLSSDRLANSALRVQASCMGMGQSVGVVAALACKYNTTPAKVPLSEIKMTLKTQGCIVPE